ncbi:UvrD-helicase domain-containing protein [Helicobacter turcicus]|nr:UvrD-helicase domain-containing protein [Helicobacter turcicus]
MPLTPEQLHIIQCAKNLKRNEILKIQAIAGSGKTSTLKAIVESLPKAKFLYLAFNKAIVEEIKSKMPKNAAVKTIHSLAYAYAKKTLKFKNINLKLTIFDIEPFFDFSLQDLSILLQNFNAFLKSSYSLESADKYTKEIWNLMLDGELNITHNFYLKYYALNSKNTLEKYDYILLDEAQDTNAVMLSIFLNNPCAKILVGDTFQNIYGFNATINALEILNANYTCILSHSFRSTQGILDYANYFLKTFSNKEAISMQSANRESLNKDLAKKAFITRTNAGIIRLIHKINKQNLKLEDFSLLKEPSSIFSPLFAIFALVDSKIPLPYEFKYLEKFNDLKSLKNYAFKSLDIEILNAIRLYEKFKFDEVLNLEQSAKDMYNAKARNIITNAHLSKGLEWDIVELFYDFPSFLELAIFKLDDELMWDIKKAKTFNFSEYFFKLNQELNLFYVAITRAKFALIDRSRNRYVKDFINRHKIDIKAHFKRRMQGDFTLAFSNTLESFKDEFEKKSYEIEAV